MQPSPGTTQFIWEVQYSPVFLGGLEQPSFPGRFNTAQFSNTWEVQFSPVFLGGLISPSFAVQPSLSGGCNTTQRFWEV